MDKTSANIDLSRNDFIIQLSASGLLTPEQLDQLLSLHPNDDALGLANSLLSDGTLNEYQFDAIAQGKSAELRLGNYDVIGRIGAGGMGTVFKARHRRMKRIVALKVLSAEFCKDESFISRFEREIETIARLGHPNIVMAYDADEAELGHFLVMEFVDGQDLVAFVAKNSPLSVAQSVDCIVQAARGLAFAHSQGVIHRDIKPANLLRDARGVVKVTDLGLARLTEEFQSSGLRKLTQAGGMMGTVEFMAPEQAIDSTTVDHRADIYSLGATLYFLLTGQPPFTGTTMMSILLKHRDAAIPSLRDSRPDTPLELDEVCQRMMAKAVADRYSSMADVVSALDAILARLGTASTGICSVATPPGSVATESSVVMGNADTQNGHTAKVSPALSVVIVEPSRVQASITRKYLEAQEITVPAVVATGLAAIAAVREHAPDAVVSALHLSDTTGVELAKQIRAEFPNKSPGFVLISSGMEGSDPGSLSRLDHVALLPKPFNTEQLVRSLNVVTGKSVAVKAAVAVAGIAASIVPPQRRDFSTIRVLIVDDSGVARMHERMVLQGLGFALITEATDGAQAIAAATREPFDLIVTDYNMPLMDGYALVSYLKQTSTTAKIPIVMVTTETSPVILDPVRKLGVVAVLDKGFSPAAVKDIVDKLFR